MTDENTVPQLYNISRRRVLGGLGAIGLASAGAGLGTTAFFSDEEVYENNVLTAGALDLVVDWEEHYYDGSSGSDGFAHGIEMSDPNDGAYIPFPTATDPVIWIHEEDLDAFMDSTSIEAYPDLNDDGTQDDLEAFEECNDFAQLDENLDPLLGRGGGKRTLSADTVSNLSEIIEDNDGVVDADWLPLVNLDDIKPGDFGELTLSMHLCDNPGYIWLQGGLVEARENGHTEPESNDPDEFGDFDEISTDLENDVELLDAIQTMLWYDEDGDNVYEPGAQGDGEVDIVIVMDRSGSMQGSRLTNAKAGAEALVDAVGDDVQVGLVSFSDTVTLDEPLTTNKQDVKDAINALNAFGTTNIEGGIDAGHEELTDVDISDDIDASGNDRDGVPKILVLLSDGEPNVDGDNNDEDHPTFGDADPTENAQAAKDAGIDLFSIAYGVASGSPTADLLEDLASDPKESHAYLATEIDEVEAVFAQIGQIIAGEECFFQGSLRTLLELVSTDHGIPLDGVRTSEYEEITGNDSNNDGHVDENYGLGDGDDPAREPYVAATTNALGLAWWLPVDHANEIQTDTVTFDLGFYTEQARHNSGAGQIA